MKVKCSKDSIVQILKCGTVIRTNIKFLYILFNLSRPIVRAVYKSVVDIAMNIASPTQNNKTKEEN